MFSVFFVSVIRLLIHLFATFPFIHLIVLLLSFLLANSFSHSSLLYFPTRCLFTFDLSSDVLRDAKGPGGCLCRMLSHLSLHPRLQQQPSRRQHHLVSEAYGLLQTPRNLYVYYINVYVIHNSLHAPRLLFPSIF